MTFDTLSYARRLKQAGVPDAQAEAMADATRELVVSDSASKGYIAALKTDIEGVRAEIAAVRTELKAAIAAVRAEIVAAEQRVMAAMETLGLRLTVRLGGLIAVGIAVLAAIIKL